MSGRLVLYFSVYGTAKRVAEEIAFQTGADLLAIEPAVPYDKGRSHYIDLARRAQREHDQQLRPMILTPLSVAPMTKSSWDIRSGATPFPCSF